MNGRWRGTEDDFVLSVLDLWPFKSWIQAADVLHSIERPVKRPTCIHIPRLVWAEHDTLCISCPDIHWPENTETCSISV